jgi:hypothetical protein
MDDHSELVGDNCLSCHDGMDRYGQFNHSQVSFALIGKHQQAACLKCHISPRTVSDFAIAPVDCYSCHAQDDAHQAAYGPDCGLCHTAEGWTPAAFDHDLSAFKLEGKHADVTCEQCHTSGYKGTPVECFACHAAPDFHAGLFIGQDCSACHTAAAWRPARYDGPHTFPMNHGEGNNVCADCHQPNLTQWTCTTCHDQNEITQEHEEEGISNFTDCLRCHPTGEEDEGEGSGGEVDRDDD